MADADKAKVLQEFFKTGPEGIWREMFFSEKKRQFLKGEI